MALMLWPMLGIAACRNDDGNEGEARAQVARHPPCTSTKKISVPTTENSNAKLGLKPSHYKRRDNSAARPSPPRAAAPTRWFGTRQTLLGHDHASGLQFPMWKV